MANKNSIQVEVRGGAQAILDNFESDIDAITELLDGDATTETQEAAGKLILDLVSSLRKGRAAKEAAETPKPKIGQTLRSNKKK